MNQYSSLPALDISERLGYRLERVLDAARQLERHPDDRIYAAAVAARIREYDDYAAAADRIRAREAKRIASQRSAARYHKRKQQRDDRLSA